MLFPTRARRKRLSLALQGGGAHGAFTWGVLDAVLEYGDFGFDGISGTSAGAMNAVLLAHGWVHGGRYG
ncbi:MAG: patatin-like phospholipase family protein, partial [Rhodocyclaceae bacterium]|nr:patatin-like phospholipase family protein [Rhodocyclaceae bacterium]